MARVLLGQSYFLRFDPKLLAAMQPYPPLGTLYAAACLREQGHVVSLFDAMLADSEDGWAAAIDVERPDYAVLYEDSFNYLSKMCLLAMRAAALRMLALARARGCVTIVCGSDATDNAARYLAGGADVVIVGEGEITLAAVLEAGVRPGGPALAEIPGLAFHDADGGLVETGRRPSMRDLDALPPPAWDLIDMERYRAAWAQHGRFSMNMATTRGCPFHCNWCAKPIWGQRYAVRSPEAVASEMAWLQRVYGVEHISFVDDILGLKPGWLETFARLVRAQAVLLPFKCLSRADLLLRDGEVEALRTAGCEMVWMGAESGSQKILDAMDKGTRVEQIVEAARRLREAGIRFGFFLQFGYPGEDRADIEATRQLVLRCLPDDIGISVSYPLPGTPFFARVQADLGPRRNWQDSADLAMLYRGPYSTRFYRRLHTVIHKEFRLYRAAGTAAPAAHLRRILGGSRARRDLARVRDALTLPFDRAVLAALARLERPRPDPRGRTPGPARQI